MNQFPTTEQETWLKKFYRLYARQHLAEKLSISEALLDEWLKHFELKKKKDAKRNELTDEAKEFIKNNWQSMTHQAIADKFGVSLGAVQSHCNRNNMKKNGVRKTMLPPKKIIPYHRTEIKETERPPTIYDAGYETTINKYLNMNI